MKGKTALVLHYNPIALYPPAESGVRFLEQNGFDVKVVTSQAPGVQPAPKLLLLFRILWFNLRASFAIARRSIDLLVVYEHLSILPVRLCRVLHSGCKVWVHFHEYSSPEEVKGGGFYSRYCWSQVNDVINDVDLYTHTNAWRLKQFQMDFDCNNNCLDRGGFIPNTPPQKWIDEAVSKRKTVKREERPLRLVYHGAVHPSTTYIFELYRILRSDPGKYSLDIYSRDEIVIGFNEDVHWHDPIPFDNLAVVLPTYDVGLILYNGHIPNYVHNVPNKFWEYRAAGLAVVVPEEMNFDLIPFSMRDKTGIFDFRGGTSHDLEQNFEAIIGADEKQNSVRPFEFHLQELISCLGFENRQN